MFQFKGKETTLHVQEAPTLLTLSPIPERAWRLRPQRLLGEDREPRLCFCLWWTQHKKTRATKNGGVVGNKLGKIGWQFMKKMGVRLARTACFDWSGPIRSARRRCVAFLAKSYQKASSRQRSRGRAADEEWHLQKNLNREGARAEESCFDQATAQRP